MVVPILSRPLTDTVARPLRTATIWGYLIGGAGLIVAFGVGGVGYVATWGAALFSDETAAWPQGVVKAIAVASGFASLFASARAAAIASAERARARTIVAAALGSVLFTGGVVAGTPAALLAGAIVGWSVAIPFERWTRLLARVGPGLGAALVLAFLTLEPAPLAAIVVIALGYPAASGVIAASDRSWRALSWRRDPERPIDS